MTTVKSIVLAEVTVAALSLNGCATKTQTGALVGDGTGALVGQAVGRNTSSTFAGAAIGHSQEKKR